MSSLDEKRASASTAAAAAASTAAPSATRRCVAGSAALPPSSCRRMARPRWNRAGSGRSCRQQRDMWASSGTFGLHPRTPAVSQGARARCKRRREPNEAPAALTCKSSRFMALAAMSGAYWVVGCAIAVCCRPRGDPDLALKIVLRARGSVCALANRPTRVAAISGWWDSCKRREEDDSVSGRRACLGRAPAGRRASRPRCTARPASCRGGAGTRAAQ